MSNDKCSVYDGWMHPLCDSIRKVVDLEKEYEQCMEALIGNFLESQTTDKRGEISGNFKLFGSFLVDNMPDRGILSCTNPHVRRAVHYLNDHLAESYSLQGVASHAGMSPSALCRLFKTETMHTIGQYLCQLRMRKAKKLLETTDLMVVEIAESAGYSNTTHFINDFKAFSGYTPLAYRLMYRHRNGQWG